MNLLKTFRVLAISWARMAVCSFTRAETLQATATIHGDQAQGIISRHIYGHFMEHLGRACGANSVEIVFCG